jgi:hypothetical protein
MRNFEQCRKTRFGGAEIGRKRFFDGLQDEVREIMMVAWL